MAFLFGKRLTPERFEELKQQVSRRDELIYQLHVGNTLRALQILGEDTGASFKEVKAALALLEKELQTSPRPTQEELNRSPFAVRNLLIKGNKGEAVRLYRHQTGVDLPEATRAVERMQLDLLEDPNSLRPLLRSGHKIEAVRHYSQTSGVSLEKAQQVVDRLEEQMRQSQ